MSNPLKKQGINLSLITFGYTIVTALIFSFIFALFIMNDLSDAPNYAIAMIAVGCFSFGFGYIIGSCFFIKWLIKKYASERIDSAVFVLIGIYVVISLLVAAFSTKFTPDTLPFERLNSIQQISWMIISASVGVYSIIFSLIIKNLGNFKTFIIRDFFVSFYPLLCFATSLVVSSILVYCFYDKLPTFSTTMCIVAFIGCVIGVLYCGALCGRFLKMTFSKQDTDTKES